MHCKEDNLDGLPSNLQGDKIILGPPPLDLDKIGGGPTQRARYLHWYMQLGYPCESVAFLPMQFPSNQKFNHKTDKLCLFPCTKNQLKK